MEVANKEGSEVFPSEEVVSKVMANKEVSETSWEEIKEEAEDLEVLMA